MRPIPVNPQIFRFSLIGLATALLIYALNIADTTTTALENKVLLDDKNQKPTAFLTKSTFRIFSSEGRLSTLHAEKAFFFNNKEDIAINNPKFSSESSNATIQLTAEKGSYAPNNEALFLEGDVIATQLSDKSGWTLKTEQLSVDNKAGILESAKKVTLTSDKHTFSGIGFWASVNDKKINLLSNVRGKYELGN